MHFYRNVTLLLGRIDLVVVELDPGVELDATEYAGSPVRSSAVAAVGGWSAAAMGGASPGRGGTWRGKWGWHGRA
jgi:hypothetical protein